MAKRKIENRFIQVILLDFDKHLGEKYEVVKVKPIFARNVLFPANKAIMATDMNLHNYKVKIESAKKDKEKRAQSLQELFAKLTSDGGILFTYNANEKGVLYEKIDATTVIDAIEKTYAVRLPSNALKMKKKITSTGEFIVPCKYESVDKEIRIVVKATKAQDVDAV